MTVFEQLFGEDKVLSAIRAHIGKTKNSTRTTKFNCPMCIRRGETPDKRMRGGMGHGPDGIGISCFNCGFKARYKMGDYLSKNMKEFLSVIGVSSMEIGRLSHWALMLHNAIANSSQDTVFTQTTFVPNFPPKKLPEQSKTISEWVQENCDDPDFLEAVQYLYDRSETIAEAIEYYWSPIKEHQINHRIIIPCYYENTIVGWTARSVRNGIEPKYYNQTPPNFLFNCSALSNPERKTVILVEGIFDALAIDAVALQGAKINEKQVSWIKNSGKRIIVLPDRDRAGGRLIDIALENGWEVSMPMPVSIGSGRGWWDSEIKDAADATKKYGKLYTLRSVMESATDNVMKIKMLRKDFK